MSGRVQTLGIVVIRGNKHVHTHILLCD